MTPISRSGSGRRSLATLVCGALAAGGLAAAGVATLEPGAASASSQREAPLISGDPQNDNTDVYAFVSPDTPDSTTIIANWIPFEDPSGGPNFYQFAEDAQYDIHIDNNGDGQGDLLYRFTFKTHIKNKKTFTWAVLKAHSKNKAGTVTLKSADPRDVPEIDFKYFEQGGEDDVQAVADGVAVAREIGRRAGNLMLDDIPILGGKYEEQLPGASQPDTKQFVKNESWGHHASCTCPIGKEEEGGVLDSRFRVHGTSGLRVVDASVFPSIPGFFIVVPIYMVSEKATDVLLEDIGERRRDI